MKAKLAGIASHTGMGGVFRLLGADVFRVERIGSAPGPRLMPPPPARNLLAATRRTCAELAAATDLGGLLDTALAGLDRHFGIEHAMLLLVDEEGRRLYTVASHGYDRSGIGSELAVGQGVVGVAARERVPIRIGHMTADTDYGMAVRDQARRHGHGPGRRRPRSRSPGSTRRRARSRCRSSAATARSACSSARAASRCASARTTRTRWRSSPTGWRR